MDLVLIIFIYYLAYSLGSWALGISFTAFVLIYILEV
jgi:hypothetical protein